MGTGDPERTPRPPQLHDSFAAVYPQIEKMNNKKGTWIPFQLLKVLKEDRRGLM